MPNLGPAELIIIMAIALVVFGPKKLPEIGKGLGNALREFNRARNDFLETINSEVDRDEPVRTTSSLADTAGYPSEAPAYTVSADRTLEYPEPLDAESADALPYGGEFQAEGDSQPAFRTAQPETAPAMTATYSDAGSYSGTSEGKA